MFGLILLLIFIYYLIRKFSGPLYRLGYKNNIKSSILLNSKDILKNRLTESNLQGIDSEFDYIIIGSGISGLTSASILSLLGNKVLVLEQHDIVGGALHVFKDKGYLFDVGLHYVGQPKQSIKDILKIITDPDIPIKFYEMNGEWRKAINGLEKVYDTFISGDKTINLKSGKEEFIQAFIEHDEFKQYEQEIRELTNDIIKRDKSSTFYYLSKTFGNQFENHTSTLLYEEYDNLFSTDIYYSTSCKYLFIDTSSTETSEMYYIDTETDPYKLHIIRPREYNIKYTIDDYTSEYFIVKSNINNCINFALFLASKTNPQIFVPFMKYDPILYITDITSFENFIVVEGRINGFTKILIHY